MVRRHNKQQPEDVGYYDDPEDRRSKKRIIIGSDIKHADPIGPGEGDFGINDDSNNDLSHDQSQDNASVEEENDQVPMWTADISQQMDTSASKSRKFGKYDWAAMSMSKQKFKRPGSSSSRFDYSESLQQDNSDANRRLMQGFGLN